MLQKMLLAVISVSLLATVAQAQAQRPAKPGSKQQQQRPKPAAVASPVQYETPDSFQYKPRKQNQSEIFFQPASGTSALSLAGGYADAKAKGKSLGAIEQTVKGYVLGAEYLYGLNDVLAFGGSLTFGSLESSGTTKVTKSGMSDPKLVMKGTSELGSARIRFGTELDISIENMKVDSNSRQTNIASGGMSLAPYVGLDGNVGTSGIIGGRLSYDINFDRTVEVPGASSNATITDGNELGISAFYEHFIADALLGGSFNYKSYETAKVKNGGTWSGAFNTKGISVYSRIPVGGVSLVPKLDYDFSQSEADTYNFITLTLIARLTF